MLFAVAAAAVLATPPANLNGPYEISPTPRGARSQPDFAKSFAAYGKGVKYFDAYSAPFETLYSQVWWAGLAPLPLPKHVVEEFEGGKIMAVVGFEVDQVIRGSDGADDLSVPITAAYNHHYSGTLNNGRKSLLEKLRAGDRRIEDLQRSMGHGAGFEQWRGVQKDIPRLRPWVRPDHRVAVRDPDHADAVSVVFPSFTRPPLTYSCMSRLFLSSKLMMRTP
jgi:hypothetical protein